MEFIRQMLLKNGLIQNDGSYVTDALVKNQLCVCDRRGRVIYHIETASNGVDMIGYNPRTRRAEFRLKAS